MPQSDSITHLSAALVSACGELRNPPCDRTNPAYHSRYATLASVLDTVRPVLAAHGLVVSQAVTTEQGRVCVETRILHKSGEWLCSTASAAADANIQRMGGAITYLRRYTLTAMLGIVGDDDDDGESSKAPQRPVKSAQRSAPPSSRPDTPAPPEPSTAVPAGYERVWVHAVTAKEAKSGKPYWSVELSFADSPERGRALTFSSTIAARAEQSVGGHMVAAIAEQNEGDKMYLALKEII